MKVPHDLKAQLESVPIATVEEAVKHLKGDGDKKGVAALPPWLSTLGPILLQILEAFLASQNKGGK